jgi:hypothetical protein
MSEGQDAEPKIAAVRYHAPSGRVFLDLSNGAMITFPVALVPALAEADDASLAEVAVTSEGYVLHWPKLAFHLSYLGILTDVLGNRAHMTRLARPRAGQHILSRPEIDGAMTRTRPRRGS